VLFSLVIASRPLLKLEVVVNKQDDFEKRSVCLLIVPIRKRVFPNGQNANLVNVQSLLVADGGRFYVLSTSSKHVRLRDQNARPSTHMLSSLACLTTFHAYRNCDTCLLIHCWMLIES
jgi:hypothetical protein